MPTTKVPASRMVDHNIGSYCFRNKIINGDMRIDQRNAGNVYTNTNGTANYGSCDRWLSFSQGSNITVQRVSGNSFGQPFPYAAIRLTGAANNTNANINQRIEAANCYDLAGQTVTISFRVVSNTTLTNCYIGGYTATTTDTWNSTEVSYAPGTRTFTSTTTPATITHTFTMPNILNGYEPIIGVNGLLAGQTIDITNVQLEVGPTATPFEYRPIGTELALCQRYYFRLQPLPVYRAGSAGWTGENWFLPVSMRIIPAISNLITEGTANRIRISDSPSGFTTNYFTRATTDMVQIIRTEASADGTYITCTSADVSAEL